MGVFICAPDFLFSRFNLPNRPAFALLAVAVALTAYAPHAGAQLVINELYYDHPGSDDGYEYIEIMNVSEAPVPLAVVQLQFHNGTGVGWDVLWSGADGEVASGALFVVGGRYVSPPPHAVAAFSVQNGPDAVRVTVAGVPSDLLAYGSLDDPAYVEGRSAPAVDAGRSLARLPDGHDSDHNAADFTAADPSPGMFNVARFDAALAVTGDTRLAAVLGAAGRERIELRITNRGQHDIAPAAAALAVWDSAGAVPTVVTRTANARSLSPGEGEGIAIEVVLSPGYHWLTATVRYDADERRHNDRLTLLRRVGGPRLLVSEILCYPTDDCPQFVELYNAGPAPIDMAGFQLRDRSHALTTITTAPVTVEPGGYVAVTPDAAGLRRYFPSAPVDRLLEHGGTWPTLNRTGSAGVSDSVVVTDALSLPVDAVSYPPVDSDYRGRSLERIDLYVGRTTQTWVLSPDPPGASPGRPGSRSLFAPPAPGSMEVTPRTFSPWSGETTTISVDAPDGIRVVLSVYDVEGRRLAELGGAIAFPAVFVWDGRHSGGSRLVPGLYIVVCESFSAAGDRIATRKVVVGCGRRRG
jgi:hypothetical protein